MADHLDRLLYIYPYKRMEGLGATQGREAAKWAHDEIIRLRAEVARLKGLPQDTYSTEVLALAKVYKDCSDVEVFTTVFDRIFEIAKKYGTSGPRVARDVINAARDMREDA